MPYALLRDELTAEFGAVLPSSLIDRTVAAVRGSDELSRARTARADVAALADAVLRRSSQEQATA